ncbi:hypothetical protein DCAR_0103574 [Daucus carota subsp. sativus]|uniref:Uncharacterized protein n=1 Tax=Daucus carota subsp. sativus TaxID=79200 RepID=A0A166I3T3_DAUCS|nr:hypothetical protein DCAR_0103574 [Daucus carota subsp. sativus]
MDKNNSELYLKNCKIMQENERLRKQAAELKQENRALFTELKHRLAASISAGDKAAVDCNSKKTETKK